MSEPNEWITTPVGRLVEGHPMVEQTKKRNGAPLMSQEGVPFSQWFMGLAIPKGPEADLFRGQVAAIAQRDWPQGQSTNGQPFSWKIEDGDGPMQVGKEGRAGHWIIRLNTTLGAPKIFMNDEAFSRILDSNFIKKGQYMRVQVGIKGNGQTDKPGVYLNLGAIQFQGYGPEIFSGPSPQEMFSSPATLPAGASATPVAGAPMPAAVVAPAPVVMPAAVVAPAPVVMPAAVVAPAQPVTNPANPGNFLYTQPGQ